VAFVATDWVAHYDISFALGAAVAARLAAYDATVAAFGAGLALILSRLRRRREGSGFDVGPAQLKPPEADPR
jgi:hypothetical protein